jgi:hypothetical protein
MFVGSNTLITGGTITQVNNDGQCHRFRGVILLGKILLVRLTNFLNL